MPNFHASIAQHGNVSDDDLKKAGRATGTDMDEKHKKFLAGLIALLDRKEIDASVPSSLVKKSAYDAISDEQKSLVDYALLNVADQLRRIEDYFRSTKTPNASPQLQTMIEHLWDMKSRLDQAHGAILKF